MKVTIRTYQIGLGAIGLFTLILLVILVAKAGSTRQDAETEKAAQNAVTKLNNYTSSRGVIPESLSDIGDSNVPDTVKYTKLSESSFKFCVTYKSASSGFDASSAVTDVATGSLGSGYSSLSNNSSASTSDQTYLYLPSTHKKGENCQTITPYLYGSSSSSDFSSYFGSNYGSSSSSSSSSESLQAKARDTERQTDLKTLQSQLEASYAQTGNYPTLANLNDATWRATNMKGMDKESLKDPSGAVYTLAATPAKNVYSYEVTTLDGKACDNVKNLCATYTLTAKLESGIDDTLYSLN